MRTKKAIMKSISGLSTRSSKIKADYQVALCEAAGHAHQYKDVTLFESILDGASGMNLQLMLKWVRANGFTLVDSKTGKCTSNKSALREADFVDGDSVVEYLTAQDAWFVKAPSVAAEAQAVDILARLNSIDAVMNDDTKVTKLEDFVAARNTIERLTRQIALAERAASDTQEKLELAVAY